MRFDRVESQSSVEVLDIHRVIGLCAKPASAMYSGELMNPVLAAVESEEELKPQITDIGFRISGMSEANMTTTILQ